MSIWHSSAFLSRVCWKYKQAENVPFLVVASATSIVLKLMAFISVGGTTSNCLLSLFSSSPRIVTTHENQPASIIDSYLCGFLAKFVTIKIFRTNSFLVLIIVLCMMSIWASKIRFNMSNSRSHFLFFLLKAFRWSKRRLVLKVQIDHILESPSLGLLSSPFIY